MTRSGASAHRFAGLLVAISTLLGLQNDLMVWVPTAVSALLLACMMFFRTEGRVSDGTWDPLTGTHLDLTSGRRRRGSVR